MSARSLLAELRRRDRVLAVTRWLNFGLFAAMLCVAPSTVAIASSGRASSGSRPAA